MREKISLLLAGLVAGALMASFMPAQAHHGDDFRTLSRKVRALQAKTQLMDSDGFFYGPVGGDQVISLCEDGSSATWVQVPVEDVDLRVLDVCATETSSPARLRKLGLRMLKR